MTKKELIKKLSIFDDNVEIVLSIKSLDNPMVLEDVYGDTDDGYVYLTD